MSKFKGKENGLHIDYIFVSEDLEIVDVDIVKYNDNGSYPSDHYPLISPTPDGFQFPWDQKEPAHCSTWHNESDSLQNLDSPNLHL